MQVGKVEDEGSVATEGTERRGGGGDDKKEEITVGSRRQCEHKVGREVGKGKRRCG